MSAIKKTFSDGEIIIKEGDVGESFFQIIEGNAGVYVNYGAEDAVKLTSIGPGKYFGEMAIIESYPRSTTVVAENDITVLEIQASELSSYFEENPDKIIEIMKNLGSRLSALTEDYDEAKGVLSSVKDSVDIDKSDSVLTKLKKFFGVYNANKNKISKPSVEALRGDDFKATDSGTIVEAYNKGTVIFKQGEVGKCMYLLHGGVVGVYTNYGTASQNKLTDLYPVSCFGEMGMISEEARTATAIAEADETYVEIIRAEDLENMFKIMPVKVEMILRHLSYRLRSLTYDYYNVCKELYEIYNA